MRTRLSERTGAIARRSIIVVLPALMAAIGVACGGSGPDATVTRTPIPTPTVADTGCRFEVPRGRTVECGYLRVPEDRGNPDGPTIRLHYARFRSQADNPAPDPVVYLAGGPGSSSLKGVPFTFNRMFAPFLSRRDFIMFDQRGTGFSEPALDCPEYLKLVYDTLDQDLSVEEERRLSTQAVLACHGRLVDQGVDPAGYTSAENAADLNDLRLALGYDEWNLYGISYGTKLALTAMRDFPGGIRSAILDSVYPLEVDAYSSGPRHAARAFAVLFDGCDADPECSSAYPELETAFFDLVDSLNETTASLTVTHPLTQERSDAILDGDGLIGFLFQSLYSAEIIPLLPEIIFDARDGTFGDLARLQGQFLAELEFGSLGMHYSVQCGEEARFTSPEMVGTAVAPFPEFRGIFDREPIFGICQEWGSREGDPKENEAVVSDIPTLVLAGEYDPITPPSWGQLAAGSLSNSFYFEFPGIGHGVSVSGQCPLGVTLAFVERPTVRPDASCIARMGGPAFITR